MLPTFSCYMLKFKQFDECLQVYKQINGKRCTNFEKLQIDWYIWKKVAKKFHKKKIQKYRGDKNDTCGIIFSVVLACDVEYNGDAHFEAEVG